MTIEASWRKCQKYNLCAQPPISASTSTECGHWISAAMSGCPSQSFINRDYINPTNRRPMVSGANWPIVGRLSVDSRPIFCPVLEKRKCRPMEKKLLSYTFFHRPTVLRFWSAAQFDIGRSSADYRPIVGRQSAVF